MSLLRLFCALLLSLTITAPAFAQLEEIIVTARRTAENLQQTPVAVTALNEAALEDAGISNLADIRTLVPSLQIAASGSKAGSLYVRGIGQRADRADLDPGVGQYLNGIFIARQDAVLLDAVDVANVQVLRGPQGTLFGKNNTGGAMLVSTRIPSTEQSELQIAGKAGSFGRRDLKISGNRPLLDNRAGLRFSLLSKRSSGYLKNESGGNRHGDEDRLAASARLVFDITDNWSADVFGFRSKQDEASVAFTCRLQTPDTLLMAQAILPGQNQTIATAERCRRSETIAKDYKVLTNPEDSSIRIQSSMLALTLNGTIGTQEFESITAWSRQFDIERYEDQDGTDYNIISQSAPLMFDRLAASGLPVPEEDRNQYSQELRISGAAFDDELQYTFGVFVALEELENTPRALGIGPQALFGLDSADLAALASGQGFGLPGGITSGVVPLTLPSNVNSQLENFTYAAFGQANWNIYDWWQLTAGARYTVEEKERRTDVYTPDFSRYAGLLNERLQARGSAARVNHLDGGIYSAIPAADFHLLGPVPPTIVLQTEPLTASLERRFTQVTPALTSTFFARDPLLEKLQLDSGMVYLTISKGFKAGGLDLRGTAIQPFDAETTDNYEIGFKLDALESRVRLNGAWYRMDYDDIQVTVAEAAGLAPINYITNAGKAVIDGFELELSLAPSPRLLILLNGGVTNADYTEYTVGTTSGDEDRSGEEFPLVPAKTFSFAAQYEFETGLGFVSPRLSWYWRDELYTGQDGDGPLFGSSTIGSQGVWNARLNFHNPDRRLRLTLYANNLRNAFHYSGGFSISRSFGTALHSIAPPRSLGLEFTYKLI